MKYITITWIFLFLIGLALLSPIIYATPAGPSSMSLISSERYGTVPSQTVDAIAGNVSELSFAADSVTQTWQGYFGNITGNIVLGNANNQSLYAWNLISAHGQVYATRNSTVPTWTAIQCANLTDIATEDTAIGASESTSADSVNNTFLNTTSIPSFYVGSVYINTTSNINSTNNLTACYGARLYNATGQSSTTNFGEVLLREPGTPMIYTSILDQKALGFDNRTHDFEMLVGENGHNGDNTATPYYFYVELG